MRLVKVLAVVGVMLTLVACGKPREATYSEVQHGMCMSDVHREKAAEIAKSFLKATPTTIAGDDQDWEDAVNAASSRAQEIACPTIIVEYAYVNGRYRPTGKWHYMSDLDVKATKSSE